MVKISILYPNKKDAHFDMDYYLNKHMPMSIDLLSKHRGFQAVSVEQGIGGGAPNEAPSFIAMCHYSFDSLESFLAAFGANSQKLQSDIPNYTDIEAVIQVSQVVIVK
jgi:uncharacterized protein (TIGR02118 family)